ncbi:hypothetical protein KILIM_031_00280 [Kineosphaera limosa NBRC 100340]|uniref:Heparinase II/III-like C-terminal domain-containing protein n=1 Tax=Kineosphaera limosa NBRC 100340 TaxID=1184609 RepID=K6WQE8_9MICO|nr:hypothetical protein KILIM_031_00280 [Kineosphaera limosa NBRC 100340]
MTLLASLGLTGVGAGQAGAAPEPTPRPNVFQVPPDLDAQDFALTQDSALAPDGGAPTIVPNDRLRAAGTPAPSPAPTPSPPSPPSAARPCAAMAEQPVVDGRPILAQLPPAAAFRVGGINKQFWQNPPVKDPTWRLYFWSLRWVGPLVRRAQADDQKVSVEALLQQVARFYVDNPDTGKSTLGWDEGGSLRRLETLNCLYRMTGDSRLPALMAKEVNVQFGPRYYGPPYHAVHNHGLMANLRVVDAGTLVDRPDWVQRASARLRSESGLAFTSRGTSYEQSSQYQAINATLWNDAARTLEAVHPGDPAIAPIRAAVARAYHVAEWLTEPDGKIVQIGDATKAPGRVATGRTETAFRDDAGGLIVGRWSWKDPNTSYYTVRYGPRLRAHGHHDKTSVTWSTAGARVLVGSGYFSYERTNPFAAYQRSPESANVAIPVGRQLDVRQSARLHSATLRSTRHRYMLTDRVYGVNHSRSVDVDHPSKTLIVADAFPAGQAGHQIWNLDPAWQLVSARGGAKIAIFRHPDGRSLRIDTTGALASAVRGSTRPVAGWNYPGPQQRVAAWQVKVRWNGGTVRTTFTVR